ncbi:CPBP family intramembrane glutamic endopeptidase [Halorarius halobius]|uniref:CPBP family intramembrane glutamic endopeptidase n=1 Tax=Halorarius halobius TaxID=2962671 RepID=UPI0020CD18A6|nr:type II CAAX endopeptidase family protein [Halorarius halobius]
MERFRSSFTGTNQQIGCRIVTGVLIAVGLWIWLSLVQTVLGPRNPVILAGFPVVRDVLSQLLRALYAVGIALVVVRVTDVAPPVEWVGIRRPVGREWGYILLGVVLMLVTLIGALFLIQALGFERTTTGSSLNTAVLYSRIITLLVLVGPAEELIFRGVVQRSLRGTIGSWPSILIAGFIFGFGHIDLSATMPGDILWLVGLSGLGVILGWVYDRTDNLVVPALAHGGFNSLTTALPLLLG